MVGEITALYRYPVKGLNPESLESVHLEAGQGLPGDRRYALARADADLDPEAPRWIRKRGFAMLMADAELARLRVTVDESHGHIDLLAPGRPAWRGGLGTIEARREVAAQIDDVLGPRPEGPLRFVESGAESFTDLQVNCLSVLNLSSVEDLERRIDRPVDPRRFRANILLRGVPAWAEDGWPGLDLVTGGARLRVTKSTLRCPAVCVDPETAERDLDLLGALSGQYGHTRMGVYAEVVEGGTLWVGGHLSVDGGA